MSIKALHSSGHTLYFCTFTCFNWLPLFEITQCYENIYKWFAYLGEKKCVDVVCYVMMPNHLHMILRLPDPGLDLNKIISNGKRFLAYEIIKRLKLQRNFDMLHDLHAGITKREKKKGQVHRVFEESFDAKAIFNESFLRQKMDYIHHNPVKGKWNLADDYTSYPHSSAAFYESGQSVFFQPKHHKDL